MHNALWYAVLGSILFSAVSACQDPAIPPVTFCKSSSDCSAGFCLQGICVSSQRASEKNTEGSLEGQPSEIAAESPPDASAEAPPEGKSETAPERAEPPPEGQAESPQETLAEVSPETRPEGQVEPLAEEKPEEGCAVSAVRPCYTGPSGTEGKGLCRAGSQTCQAGTWGPCTGAILPKTEICNQKDDDCDGKIDNGFEAFGQVCIVGLGVCQNQGTLRCKADGTGLECSVSPKPTVSQETCDLGQLDEDCDGSVNEGCTCLDGESRPCGNPSQGECRAGTQTCQSSVWGPCVGEKKPTPEICDNKDNDCDGKTDEAVSRPCISSTNTSCKPDASGGFKCTLPCKQGIQLCNRGVWESVCRGEYAPLLENCNGEDDDCDGKIDENAAPTPSQACYTGPAGTQGVGRCRGGVTACIGGVLQCSGEMRPDLEACNGADDDCDGRVDEGLPSGASCYYGPSGTQGVGLCKSGTIRCVNGAYACVGMVLPSAEVCGDSQDNDCDGRVDGVCYKLGVGTEAGACLRGTCAGSSCQGTLLVPCINNADCGGCNSQLGSLSFTCKPVPSGSACLR